MNLGVKLSAAEKVFGPALPGRGPENMTLSAVPFSGGRAAKYAGVVGVHANAKFYIHFPTPVDWNLLKTSKGVPDFVNDLKESGPQGDQGRDSVVVAFMENYGELRAKTLSKLAAGEKKAASAAKKARMAKLLPFRQRFIQLVGERDATLIIESESFNLPFTITVEKSGKVKITAVL